ncbi:MAG: transporter substrate-binding domain-containing protein [Desulfarculus sp.]|nr:transporter substrate-binding domain-containing protein [Desulfarculus sp.]
MRRSLLVCLCLTLLAAVWCPGPALAGPVLDRVVHSGVLRVGASLDNPPLTFLSRSGQPEGYEVDLAKMVAGGLGVKLSMVAMPADQLLPALSEGKVDLVISAVTMYPDRNRQVMLVGPYLLTGQSILTNARLLSRLTEDFEHDQPELAIAAAKGTTSAEAVKELFPKARLVEVADQEAGLKALLDRRVDALVADHNFCVVATLRFRDQGLATLPKPFSTEPLGVGFSEDALFYNWMENFFLVLRGTGRLDGLRQKWLESPNWLAELPPDQRL